MKYINLFIAFIIFSGCENGLPSTLHALTKMSYHDIKVDAIENSFMEHKELIFIDSTEKRIERQFVINLTRENPGKYFIQPFQDSTGKVKYAKIQVATREDKIFMAEMDRILNEDPDVFVRVIDCSTIKSKLSEVLVRDSDDRNTLPKQKRDSLDRINLSIVISIIENCGAPNMEVAGQEGILAIFLTLQHSSYRYIKQYLYVIKNYEKLGFLGKKQLVTMEDRILMNEGLPQKYGSQLIGKELYEVDNMDSVLNRRKKLDMLPLKEYLASFNR